MLSACGGCAGAASVPVNGREPPATHRQARTIATASRWEDDFSAMVRAIIGFLLLCLSWPLIGATLPVGAQVWTGEQSCERAPPAQTSPGGEWQALLPDTAPRPSDTWVRVPLPAAWPPQVLAIPAHTASSLWIHRPGVTEVEQRALRDPRPPYDGSAYWHTVPLVAPVAGDLLLCLRASSVQAATIELLPAAEQTERELWLRTLIAGSLAIMLAMSAFALVFWIALRDRLYLYYLGHLLTFMLWQGLVTSTLAGLVAWVPETPRIVPYLQMLLVGLSAVFITTFGRHFLDLKHWHPRWDRWVRRMSVATLVLGVVGVVTLAVPTLRPLIVNLQNVLIGLTALSIVALAVVMAWRGHRYASYFVAGWAAFLVLVLWTVVYSLTGDARADTLRVALLPAAALEALLLSIGIADRSLALRRERDAARRLAEVDALTGVFNRRGFQKRLEARLADRSGGSLLFCDLDHFKQINDRHGHPAGDRCLQAFAERAARVLPDDALIGRYGGEEFAILLTGTDPAVARAGAERLRAEIAAAPVVVGQSSIPLRVSIGATCIAPATEHSAQQVLADADAAVYRAKAAGRDRVELATAR